MSLLSHRALLGAALVLGTSLAAAPAHASLLYSNLSPSSPLFSYSGGYFLMGSGLGSQSDNTYAVSFTPAVSEYFYFANFALRLDNDYHDYATISLCQDSGGLPGTVLESLTSPAITPQSYAASDAYTSIFSSLQPQLIAGTTYWFKIDLPELTSVTWLPSNTNDITTNPGSGFAWKTSGSSPWYSAAQFPYSQWERPAFMVYGSPVLVPEPASLSLLALAACMLGLKRHAREGM